MSSFRAAKWDREKARKVLHVSLGTCRVTWYRPGETWFGTPTDKHAIMACVHGRTSQVLVSLRALAAGEWREGQLMSHSKGEEELFLTGRHAESAEYVAAVHPMPADLRHEWTAWRVLES